MLTRIRWIHYQYFEKIPNLHNGRNFFVPPSIKICLTTFLPPSAFPRIKSTAQKDQVSRETTLAKHGRNLDSKNQFNLHQLVWTVAVAANERNSTFSLSRSRTSRWSNTRRYVWALSGFAGILARGGTITDRKCSTNLLKTRFGFNLTHPPRARELGTIPGGDNLSIFYILPQGPTHDSCHAASQSFQHPLDYAVLSLC